MFGQNRESVPGDIRYFGELNKRIESSTPQEKREVMGHVSYLAEKAGCRPDDLLSGKPFNVHPQVQSDAIRNIDSVLKVEKSESSQHSVTYIGDDLCLVRTRWGGHVVVPTFNVDVTIGILRDGIHEAWTTRAVQELLQEGQTYVNVGANFGYYTCLGARIVGHKGTVISVEANPHVFCILMKTIMYAGIVDRVRAYNRAAFLEAGKTLDFVFDYQYIGGGHLTDEHESVVISSGDPFWSVDSIPSLLDETGKWVVGRGIMNPYQVETLRLDDITHDLIADLIHCDVETAEPYVLLGAIDLLHRSPNCKIIFEWSGHAYQKRGPDYRDAVHKMLDLFNELGYRIRTIHPRVNDDGSIEVSEYLSREEFLKGDHGDYIAIKAGDDPWTR